MTTLLQGATPLVLMGAGRMGTAMLGGWLQNGLPPAGVTVIDPDPCAAATSLLREHSISHMPQFRGPLAAAFVVLAIKPQVMAPALAQLAGVLDTHARILSIAAGTTIETLETALGPRPIIRAMPNTPAQVAQAMTALCANERLTQDDRAVVEALMGAIGKIAWLDREALMDAVTALSGSGPAYVFYMAECLARAGAAAGLDEEDAMAMARQTILGAAVLLDHSEESAAILRRNVTSRGGTTAAALEVLMDENTGLAPLMRNAVAAAAARSRALAG